MRLAAACLVVACLGLGACSTAWERHSNGVGATDLPSLSGPLPRASTLAWRTLPSGAAAAEVAADEAPALWSELAGAVGTTHRWPVVVLGDALDGDRLDRSASEVDSVVADASRVDVDDWLESTAREVGVYGETKHRWMTHAEPATRRWSALADASGTAAPGRAVLVLLPTEDAWSVHAYVPFGGWNLCPDDPTLTAFYHRWSEAYDARPYLLGPDSVEFLVDRPPGSAAAAADLADEQAVVAPDVVWQGTRTSERLARQLWDSSVWLLWWD